MDIDELVAAFEAGEIDNSEFPHRRHVEVSWGLAQRYGRDEGLRRMVDGIRAIAERAGRPEAYHETITRAWFELIAAADDLHDYPDLLDKTLLGRYYSAERLAEGRSTWLEPDLHPLTLPPPPAQAASATDVRAVLRRVPVAVGVLGTLHERTVHAATVSSIASVSAEPPLISVCLARGSRTLEQVRQAQAFAVSILAAGQDELAETFGSVDRPTGSAQFAAVPHQLTPQGPVIDNGVVWIACSVYASHPCGDHEIVIGEVQATSTTDRRPLVRHDGSYH
jgi:flavin reductase (DIM6/NTAB) family NADH-FMN oxidoreductase RutF